MSQSLVAAERINKLSRWGIALSPLALVLNFLDPLYLWDFLPDSLYLPLIFLILLLFGLSILTFFISGIIIFSATPKSPPHQKISWLVPLGIFALALATIAFYYLYFLVWNPVAKVPDLAREEIFARMIRERQFSYATIIGTGIFGALPLLAIFPAHLLLSRLPRYTWIRAIGFCAGLACVGLFFIQFGWGFHTGMALADTFYTTGYDTAPGGAINPLSLIVFFALSMMGLLAPSQAHTPQAQSNRVNTVD